MWYHRTPFAYHPSYHVKMMITYLTSSLIATANFISQLIFIFCCSLSTLDMIESIYYTRTSVDTALKLEQQVNIIILFKFFAIGTIRLKKLYIGTKGIVLKLNLSR